MITAQCVLNTTRGPPICRILSEFLSLLFFLHLLLLTKKWNYFDLLWRDTLIYYILKLLPFNEFTVNHISITLLLSKCILDKNNKELYMVSVHYCATTLLKSRRWLFWNFAQGRIELYVWKERDKIQKKKLYWLSWRYKSCCILL